MAKKRKIRIVTHGTGFHSDDVFGVATLLLFLKDKDVEVIRTWDMEIISQGDYVLDIGGVYDPDTNRFDHHQEGGAGKRENGIEYASFGLIWKKFGSDVAGSPEVATQIDRRLVQPVDAVDNGIELLEPIIEGVFPYTLQRVVGTFEPTHNPTPEDLFKGFMDAVVFAQKILYSEIDIAQKFCAAQQRAQSLYEKSEDKRIIIFDTEDTWGRNILTNTLVPFSEPLYFVHPHKTGNWQVVAVTTGVMTYEMRKRFPEEWSGKRDEALAKITGIADATFCHRSGFMCVAKTKEGAIALAHKALEV